MAVVVAEQSKAEQGQSMSQVSSSGTWMPGFLLFVTNMTGGEPSYTLLSSFFFFVVYQRSAFHFDKPNRSQ
jgi:hypothetical protein